LLLFDLMMQLRFKKVSLKTQLNVAVFLMLFANIGLSQSIGSSLEPDFLADQKVIQSESNTRYGLISISNELQFKPGTKLDQDNYSAKAKLWSNKNWSVTGRVEVNDLKIIDTPKNSSNRRLAINKKLFTAGQSNSYLALGLGWQDISLNNAIDSEGINVSLLGKYSVTNNFLVYGEGSLFESLQSDYTVSGYQFETGIKYSANKRFSFSAGVKVLDFENQNTSARNSSSSFLLGTHLSF